jgi:hypothetical protein
MGMWDQSLHSCQSSYQGSQPDCVESWRSSLAVDNFGNVAADHSGSTENEFAEIRFGGRLMSDTLSTLGKTEATLIASTSAQTGNCGRNLCIS